MLYNHAGLTYITMKTELFDYYLPKELIAQMPLERRDESRLMVLNRATGEILHKKFYEVIDFFGKGDLLITNNTKVIPARIFACNKKRREILLIKETAPLLWETFIRPQRGLKLGEEISLNNGSITAKVIERTERGAYIIQFSDELPLQNIGYAPLPPYIKRDYTKSDMHEYDKIRYQTIYAENPGAIAAPTAGMHFTEELLAKVKKKGTSISPVTLHVGIGTFRPVRAEYVKDHEMMPEWYNIPGETTKLIKKTKGKGRIIAVGTTTTRVVETCIEGSGYTNAFIYPPYEFKIIDALITNLHLPKSTLLMLVSAFACLTGRQAGRDLIMKAYEEAVKEKYRFFSYGDAMLII